MVVVLFQETGLFECVQPSVCDFLRTILALRVGGIVSVSGEWEVKPRIIFISDGRPTESTESGDRDIPSNITNVR